MFSFITLLKILMSYFKLFSLKLMDDTAISPIKTFPLGGVGCIDQSTLCL
jgi:hypothetical protein